MLEQIHQCFCFFLSQSDIRKKVKPIDGDEESILCQYRKVIGLSLEQTIWRGCGSLSADLISFARPIGC